MSWTRAQMAARAAAELSDGEYVNLGIGLPTLIPDYLPADSDVMLHAENGILGVGPFPYDDEVDPDLVNAGSRPCPWMVPGAMVKGIGGAMDLVNGAGRVIVLMDHVVKSGAAKLVSSCDLPLTGKAVVSRVITDLGVFDVTGDGFAAVELAPGVEYDEVLARTGAPVTDARAAASLV